MASKATRWTPLENQIYRKLTAHKVGRGKALVAVSGGLDSMLLVTVLKRLSKALKLELAVVHIHHGGRDAFRKKAQKLVTEWCQQEGLICFSETSKVRLQTENEARQFRLQVYRRAQKSFQADWLFLGHHQDDLLETRLLRLLRGTGPDGLKAMKMVFRDRVRPFLETSKKELMAEAQAQALTWVEDPSNQESLYLRNWLRNVWLLKLEQKSPGASKALARSLELLLENHDSMPTVPSVGFKQGISKAQFLCLSESEKKTCLARYISSLEIRNLTQNHIQEILRHLDNSKNVHTFTVAQLNWTLTKDMIFAVRRDSNRQKNR
jgi:tRNA(Ile)-lysidine synthase